MTEDTKRMENFLKQFKISDFKEHVQTKAMWAGKTTPINIPDLYGIDESNTLVKITSLHTPALFKSIDEIIVNAIDHSKTFKKVKTINVLIEDDGYITVYNDGPGIPIIKHSESDKYCIQLAFSQFLTGTNIEKSKDCIKGGTNGLGAKITNIHSNHFIVETVYNKQKYIQEFKNRLNIIQPPVIKPTSKSDYTKIKFLLVYNELGYDNFNTIKIDIINWLRLRLYQVALYVGETVEVNFNDSVIPIKTTEEFAKMFLSDKDDIIVSTQCKNNKYSLSICAIIASNNKKSKKLTHLNNTSIINGVVSNKGSHIVYIRNKIKDYIENKLKKISKKSTIDSKNLINIRLLISGCIPGVDWSGQNKDNLQISQSVLDLYKISNQFYEDISSLLINNLTNIQPTKEKIEHDKYIKAKNINQNSLKNKCMLLAAEGDSAITLLRTGLTQKCNKMYNKTDFAPSFDWLGIISLQGVIINAAKEIVEHETTDGILNIRSDKLRKNKRLNMLADAFGLRYDYTYSTDVELKTLNYDKLIICTDQDLDGIGKICSLVLVWIYTFWPNLIKYKKIGKLQTPIIRVYKNKEKLDFYYDNDFNIWLKTQKLTNAYRIKYYKGLATHDTNEAEDMFKLINFNNNIYMYELDDISHNLFKIYFGPDSNIRKQQLLIPVKYLDDSEVNILQKTKIIPIGRIQLDIDTKLYKLEAINRQLPNVIDGLNPSRRKILTASIMRFSQDSKEVKIFQLGGYVADKMLYHHGDASLNKTIINMAQSFYGARKYPYLIGVGQFGSRHGDKAGSSRYISVKLSNIVNLLFPSEDKWLLSYTFDENVRTEPEYYVPILPMAVLESYQIVTEGWNHKSFNRSLQDVVTLIKDYINNKYDLIHIVDKFIKNHELPEDILNRYKLNTDIKYVIEYKNIEYSFGQYVFNKVKNLIHITELPYGVSTEVYLENISKLTNYIMNVENYSSTDEIDIKIYLHHNILEQIENKYGNEEIDPIQECFKLYTSLRPNLNYSYNKNVLEFGSNYLAIILYWLPIRKEFYKKRIIRKNIILKFNILREESIIKYIQLSNKLNISNIEDDNKVSEILLQNKFKKINNSLLTSPMYTSNDDLENLILNSDNATFDYILDLRERELTKISLENRQSKLLKLKEEYNKLQKQLNEEPFIGSTIWLEEINNFLHYLDKKI